MGRDRSPDFSPNLGDDVMKTGRTAPSYPQIPAFMLKPKRFLDLKTGLAAAAGPSKEATMSSSAQ
jgi:hypothetical protein